ncbi:hypothetical protein ACIOV9_19830 [Pseudomonas iridis]
MTAQEKALEAPFLKEGYSIFPQTFLQKICNQGPVLTFNTP